MIKAIDYAMKYYNSDKSKLNLRQRVLYKEYLSYVDKYSKECEKLSETSKFNMSIDDLVMAEMINIIRCSILYSTDEESLNETQNMINLEIERIQIVLEGISVLKDNYKSFYTEEEIRNFFFDNPNLEQIIKLNNLISYGQTNDIKSEVNRKYNSKNNIIEFPTKRNR